MPGAPTSAASGRIKVDAELRELLTAAFDAASLMHGALPEPSRRLLLAAIRVAASKDPQALMFLPKNVQDLVAPASAGDSTVAYRTHERYDPSRDGPYHGG